MISNSNFIDRVNLFSAVPSIKRILLYISFISVFAIAMPEAIAQSDFSIDPDSPERTTEGWSPADIILSDGSDQFIEAGELGLSTFDDINAFSYGYDEIEPLGPMFYVTIYYSVDRLTIGRQRSMGVFLRH